MHEASFVAAFNLEEKYGVSVKDVKYEMYRLELERMIEDEIGIVTTNRSVNLSSDFDIMTSDAYDCGYHDGVKLASYEYAKVYEDVKELFMDIWAKKKMESDIQSEIFFDINVSDGTL